jgi:hypothetical protein
MGAMTERASLSGQSEARDALLGSSRFTESLSARRPRTVHKLWGGARDYLCVYIAVKAKLSAQRLQAGNHALRGVVRISQNG